jgi:hypothetical protein
MQPDNCKLELKWGNVYFKGGMAFNTPAIFKEIRSSAGTLNTNLVGPAARTMTGAP